MRLFIVEPITETEQPFKSEKGENSEALIQTYFSPPNHYQATISLNPKNQSLKHGRNKLTYLRNTFQKQHCQSSQ